MTEHTDAVVARLGDAPALGKIIGESPVFVRAIATLALIAHHTGTVLITGETGTGKELAARAIHYLSDRASHSFVPVNCGSLSDSLVEDTLFGHESGAFTDARGRATGLVAVADKGTLLLDEIGTLPGSAQTALLRFCKTARIARWVDTRTACRHAYRRRDQCSSNSWCDPGPSGPISIIG